MAVPQAHLATTPIGEAARPRRLAGVLRALKVAGVAVGLVVAAVGGYWGALQYQGNLHPVADGVLYRSAQPSGSELAAAVRQYGIKSVLNLRGANPGSPWYDNEITAAGDLHLTHYDYPLSAKRFVTRQQITQILDILERAPKPLLIHCKDGADRTGLVAALYRFVEAGASAADADQQLSLLYGHFPYLTSRSVAMDNSFWAFVRDRATTAAR